MTDAKRRSVLRHRWLRTLAFLGAAASVAAGAGREDLLDERVRALREALRGAVSSNGWRASRYSVLALSLETGDTLFAQNAHDRLAPASNMKLLTTATALRYLGPDFRYQTFLLAEDPIDAGHLKGDLVLYGTGDPGLSEDFQGTHAFEQLADALVAAGISAIDGAIVGDGTFFSGPLRGEGWNPDDMNDWFTAASSGLTYDENMVTLRVVPTSPGSAPEVRTIPDGAGVPMVVTAVTGGDGPRVMIKRTDPMDPIAIEGSLSSGGREIWRQMTVPDPAHFAASVLLTVLQDRGIRVAGGVKDVADASSSKVTGRSLWAPAIKPERRGARVIAHHQSGPIIDYLKIVNKKSHNLFADVTLKTVGRIVAGDGSFNGGAGVVRRFLAEEVKTDTTGLVQLDGSGLSVHDRISAATFVDLLKHMAQTKLWDDYWETLPEAGNPHELRRMFQTPAAGNLRAKTGTIDHVSALSGVVRSANGERIAFSIIANDVPTTWAAKRIEDRIGVSLASFERPFTVNEPEVRLASDSIVPDSGQAGTLPAPTIGSAPTVAPAPQPPVVVAEQPAPPAATATSPAPAPSKPVAAPAPAPRTHKVAQGENLTVIAKKYGVSVNALVKANPKLSPRRLMPGAVLRVPVREPGEAPAERQDVHVHVVKSGDSFSTIARAYDVSVNALIEANPGINPRRLQLGQKVSIPEPTQG